MSNTVNFEKQKERIIRKKNANLIRAKQVRANEVIQEDKFKEGFQKLLKYHSFDDAYGWLYDQILFEAGLIEEDECYPMQPCTPEELSNSQNETDCLLTEQEHEALVSDGRLPF